VALNGLPDGRYGAEGRGITVIDGIIRLEKDGRLAGSSLSLDRAVYTMISAAGVPLCEAVRMASLNPARILGLEEKKGSIAVGKDADLTLFDERISVREVFLKGKRVNPGSGPRTNGPERGPLAAGIPSTERIPLFEPE
jgi:N-acetylglucosamine-6-phosphate deacetylase